MTEKEIRKKTRKGELEEIESVQEFTERDVLNAERDEDWQIMEGKASFQGDQADKEKLRAMDQSKVVNVKWIGLKDRVKKEEKEQKNWKVIYAKREDEKARI